MILAFADKPFPTLGAGNGDFTLSPGDTHRLAALGAIKVPVIPVLDPVQQLQEFPVFLVALIGVPGEDPENGPAHQGVVADHEDQFDYRRGDKQTDQHQNDRSPQGVSSQFVRAVAAHHNMLKPLA